MWMCCRSLYDIQSFHHVLGRYVPAPAVGPPCVQWQYPPPPLFLSVCQHRLGLRWAAPVTVAAIRKKQEPVDRDADFIIIKKTVFSKGANRFYDDITDMIGYRPYSIMKYCWCFVTPFVLFVSSDSDCHFSPPLSLVPSLFLASVSGDVSRSPVTFWQFYSFHRALLSSLQPDTPRWSSATHMFIHSGPTSWAGSLPPSPFLWYHYL